MRKILVDSDAFYALVNPKDPNHLKAIQINTLIKQKTSLHLPIITNLVLYEVCTLLSYRLDQTTALRFLNDIETSGMQVYPVDGKIEKNTFGIFSKQTQEGTSMVDCANMAVMEELRLKVIFSFDQIYKRNGYTRVGVDQPIKL